jgi:hypothetical protein
MVPASGKKVLGSLPPRMGEENLDVSNPKIYIIVMKGSSPSAQTLIRWRAHDEIVNCGDAAIGK